MNEPALDIVILGLSITSSWGNGHATTYRGIVRELDRMGHNVLFLERDVVWYRDNRDMPDPSFCRTELYESLEELKDRFAPEIRRADLVIVGSYVAEGVEVGAWVQAHATGITAFYDIDTPVTLSKLKRGDFEYLHPSLIPQYDIYLSFTGGPTLSLLEQVYGSPKARALYCSVDPALYFPETHDLKYDLGYLGTYSDDRQPMLDRLMLEPARRWKEGRFIVAGPQYPESLKWPENVERIVHLSPALHRKFYNEQRFTLNITRADMVRAGYSPSVRLFEAAACGTPIISDFWDGLDTIFTPGEEVLISHSPEDTLRILRETPEEERQAIGERARRRVLSEHTATHRANALVSYAHGALATRLLKVG